jgi:dimethylhistidine N-methyltransferase
MNPLPLKQPEAATGSAASTVAEEVLLGLTGSPKTLPPRLFYDDAGSRLFEQITGVQEYYLTRTERGILEQNAGEIMRNAGTPLTLIELGAGTATKTEILIHALLKRQLQAVFYPIDVSGSALRVAEEALEARFPALSVRPLVGDYSAGLTQLSRIAGRKLVLYIGSSIGNYEPREAGELLANIRGSLSPGDALLLGIDMAPSASKPEATLLAAYNDAQGVTARFNLNILTRINRELGADFDLSAFRHRATWNPAHSRIEMHVESLREQVIRIADLDIAVHFERGETIHTENSYKFSDEMLSNILADGGFLLEHTWSDDSDWFGVHLTRVD